MAPSKTEADTPKTGGVKKWDGNAERDLCLAMIFSLTDGEKTATPNWNVTHTVMKDLGHEFSKDAMW